MQVLGFPVEPRKPGDVNFICPSLEIPLTWTKPGDNKEFYGQKNGNPDVYS